MTDAASGAAPRVTIAIPTFNRADKLLGYALERALGQSATAIEVIVADNASEDRTTELVSGLQDDRLRYQRHAENIGWSANFDWCVDAARGEYFLLFHDDDEIDLDFVETCLAALDDSGLPFAGVVRTGTRIIDGAGRVTYESPNRSTATDLPGLVRDWTAGRFAPYLCSTLFHTRTLREVGGFAPANDHWQDVHTQFRVAAVAPWVHVQACKAAFRHHEGELTHAANLDPWIVQAVGLADEVARLLPPGHPAAAEARAFLAELTFKRCRGVQPFAERQRQLARIARRFDRPHAHWRWLLREQGRRVGGRLARALGRGESGSDGAT